MTNKVVSDGKNMIECSSCGSLHDVTEICDCGYDPSLEEKKKQSYYAKHALTATLDTINGKNGPEFGTTVGEE